jgi:hypothetical protein
MDIPWFAAIRIASCVTKEEQQDLIRLVLGVQEVRCIANAFDFYQQLWLGLWRKYAGAPHVATSNRKDKSGIDMACKALLRRIDSTMALRPRCLITQLVPETAYRIAVDKASTTADENSVDCPTE